MNTKILFLLIVISIPVITSLLSLLKVKFPTTLDDFFFANKEINSKEFIDTTVAYAFQIAAISLFASWGYKFGFWTIWVPIFWFASYRILKWLNDRDYLDNFIKSKTGDTIHGFIAKQYKWKYLSALAGLATLIGLSGTAFFEAEFVSSSIISTIPNSASGTTILLFAFFVLITLLYIIIGGFKAIVWTDSIQLKTGYIAILVFMGITFGQVILNGYIWSGYILFVLTLSLILFLTFQYKKLNSLNSTIFKKKYSITSLLGLLLFITSLLVKLSNGENLPVKDSFISFIQSQNFSNPLSLGFPAILSLFIANFLWQIVDISNWQRISSYKSDENYKQSLSQSISFASIYSPVTWALSIFFGMAFKYVNGNISSEWTVLQDICNTFFNSNMWLDNAYILILFFGMVMIMFSTLDSLISSISYTVYEDIVGLFNKKRVNINGARLWTAIFTITFFILYVIARSYVSKIDKILYAFYSFQIALFPTIFFLLINRKLSSLSAVCSISSGIIASVIVLVYSDPYSYAALFVIIVSMTFYFLPKLFNHKNNGNNNFSRNL